MQHSSDFVTFTGLDVFNSSGLPTHADINAKGVIPRFRMGGHSPQNREPASDA